MAFAPSVAFDYLRRAHAAGRLAHAYLLVGDGDSAGQLAGDLAALVLPATPDRVWRHPDMHRIEPESKARRIVIEQVRDLENALRLRASVAGGRKVGIIREADRMSSQAANAFLKTLEEPPAGSLLLLLTALPEALPETILSRCLKVVLSHDATSADASPTAEVTDLLARLAEFARRPVTHAAAIPTAYGFLREFNALLVAIRTRIQDETDEALAAEKDRYAKTTDGSWIEEREDYYKAMVEARYVAARARMIETLARWWGDALRACTGSDGSSAAKGAAGAAELARRLAPADLLRRLKAIDELRENLNRNIGESLALEGAFLRVFNAESPAD